MVGTAHRTALHSLQPTNEPGAAANSSTSASGTHKTSIKGPLDALRAMRRKDAGGGAAEEGGEKSQLDAKTKNNMELLKELKGKQKS